MMKNSVTLDAGISISMTKRKSSGLINKSYLFSEFRTRLVCGKEDHALRLLIDAYAALYRSTNEFQFHDSPIVAASLAAREYSPLDHWVTTLLRCRRVKYPRLGIRDIKAMASAIIGREHLLRWLHSALDSNGEKWSFCDKMGWCYDALQIAHAYDDVVRSYSDSLCRWRAESVEESIVKHVSWLLRKACQEFVGGVEDSADYGVILRDLDASSIAYWVERFHDHIDMVKLSFSIADILTKHKNTRPDEMSIQDWVNIFVAVAPKSSAQIQLALIAASMS